MMDISKVRTANILIRQGNAKGFNSSKIQVQEKVNI